MKLTRRKLLQLGLGATQLALLERVSGASVGGASCPTKLLTIYVPGGWVPFYLWCPFSDAAIGTHIPAPAVEQNEPVFFDAAAVENLDGSGRALQDGFQRLRVPVLWDEQALGGGMPDPSSTTAPHGYSWRHHRLWENASVVHGVDMGSAAHASALIGAMCGVPGPTYKSPALHAFVAQAMFERFGDARPLTAVSIGRAPTPNPVDLPATAASTSIPTLEALEYTLSERKDSAWQGLRDRASRPQLAFDGSPLMDPMATTSIEQHNLANTRALRGATNAATDAFYERIYATYRRVSKELARDIVSVIEATPGVEHSTRPHWVPQSNWTYFGTSIGPGINSDSGRTWLGEFELALKLLKSDLTSAISLRAPGLNGFYFDTHSSGHAPHFVQLRATFDVVGRLLGEMKATPTAGGRTLLDDTLVVFFSEFGRTWPMGRTCDHWPGNSVCFAGGNVAPNRMVGNYDLTTGPPDRIGFMGEAVALTDEGGQPMRRAPKANDVVFSALHLMGIDSVFIPGGPGVIGGLV